jgi:hypothetical protein
MLVHHRGETVKKSLQWNDFRSNGYNECFNGTLRREVLNAECFGTTRQAQIVIFEGSNNTIKSGRIRPCLCVRQQPKQS